MYLSIHIFQLLGGSSEIIQFKTVMLDALSKLFITSGLGNEISLQVKIDKIFQPFSALLLIHNVWIILDFRIVKQFVFYWMGCNAYFYSKIPINDVTSNAKTTHFDWLSFIGMHFFNFCKGTSTNSSREKSCPWFLNFVFYITGCKGNCILYTTAQTVFVSGC